MKKTLLLIITCTIICSSVVSGQSQQVGLRAGFRGGIFYQVTSKAGNAELGYHALLSFNNHGLQLTGLRIIYGAQLSEISPDLYLSWGYGAHLGFENNYRERYLGEIYSYRERQFNPVAGVDGWGSLEYRFREVPLNISLNIKPYVELSFPSFVRFMPADLGLSVSYVF
jgi:hypothetical protein